MAENTRKLRILCLHGYRQNARSFKEKMYGFRKCVKKFAELVYVTAPNALEDEPNDENAENSACVSSSSGPVCSWWFSNESNRFSSLEACKEVKGFEESVKVISEAFRNLGPFDGILGFSQGAAFVALLCALKECGEFPHAFQFVILISGFKSMAECHQYLYEKPITTKCLHVIGEEDLRISTDRSEELARLFQFCEVAYHDGGHYVPCNLRVKIEYRSFFKDLYCSINKI